MAYCQPLLQCPGHGQQELTFYLPFTALGGRRKELQQIMSNNIYVVLGTFLLFSGEQVE
jgi:hypothetical protein